MVTEKQMTEENKPTFEEALGDNDWGLIIDKAGRLKGLFIPDGCDEDDVPASIVQLCIDHFGIDKEEFFMQDPTIH